MQEMAKTKSSCMQFICKQYQRIKIWAVKCGVLLDDYFNTDIY